MAQPHEFPGGRNPAEFVEPYDSPDRALWICMDDRRLDPNSWLDADTRYNQLAGGGHGIGVDVAVAMEIRSPGSFVDQRRPVHQFAKNIVAIAGGRTVERPNIFLNHEGCAAFAGAVAIAQTVIQHPALTFESAVLAKPDIDEDIFMEGVRANERILSSGLIVASEIADTDMQRPEPPTPAIPKVRLLGEHNARAFQFDYQKGTVLNVPAANQAGVPVYHTSMGALEEVYNAIKEPMGLDTVGVTLDDLQTATAMRVAAIQARHLPDPSVSRLPIKVLGHAA